MDIFSETVGQPYPRPVPRAGQQRADALNNKAVSFWNLGKQHEAFQAWEGATELDAAHAETVYNRAVVEWRLGRIDDSEALLRLEHSKSRDRRAGAYLGYFHLERSRPEEAEKELDQVLRVHRDEGLFWRRWGTPACTRRSSSWRRKPTRRP
ncbi:MAG: hypothetical protein HY319_01810 [Armatimonadetes bacterium]|nr:hypothetical protein [Armatimonadota bacterium]